MLFISKFWLWRSKLVKNFVFEVKIGQNFVILVKIFLFYVRILLVKVQISQIFVFLCLNRLLSSKLCDFMTRFSIRRSKLVQIVLFKSILNTFYSQLTKYKVDGSFHWQFDRESRPKWFCVVFFCCSFLSSNKIKCSVHWNRQWSAKSHRRRSLFTERSRWLLLVSKVCHFYGLVGCEFTII